jgi:hypothetical protein
MKKFLLVLPLFAIIAAFTITLIQPIQTLADFNSSDVADDYTFDNVGTMNVSQINNFLNSFAGSCISTNNGFTAPDPIGYSPSAGYTYGGSVSAGQVIYDAAQAYDLNPQVLLTTLQKEQSLVSGTSGCSTLRYTGAVGYGCPDGGTAYSYSGVDLYSIMGNEVTSVSGTCVNTAAKAGFSEQIIHAAWLLKFGEERSEGNTSWSIVKGNWDNSDDPESCYLGPMTQGNRQQCPGGASVYYDGYTTIDGVSTHMDTGATAALYWYTPHFAGNQSFDTIFQSWFGATTGQGFERVISDNTSDTRQWVVYGNIKQYLASSQVIYAWGLENTSLITMPAAQLAAIPTGPSLDVLSRLNTNPNSPVYFMDGGVHYLIPWPNMMSAWNLGGRTISNVSPGLFNLSTNGASLSYAVKDPSSTSIYMLDGANSSGQTVIRPYANTAMFQAWEGDAATYTTLDTNSGFFSNLNQAIGATITTTKVSYNGNNYQVANGYKMLEPSTATDALYPGSAQPISAMTAARLPTNGTVTYIAQATDDSAVYLIDNGVKHHILWSSTFDAWGGNITTVTPVNDAFLATIPSGSDISSYFANDNGQLYIMDGAKMTGPTALTTAYTNAGAVLDISSALDSLLPSTAAVATGYIIPQNESPVYMLDNSGQLRHLLYGDSVTAWGGYQAGLTVLPDYIVAGMTQAASPSNYVSDGSQEYYLDNGEKWILPPSIKTDWGITGTAQVYSDGTLSRIPTGGTLTASIRDTTGGYYYMRNGVADVTFDPNIAQAWGITGGDLMSPRFIPSNFSEYMLTRFVQSSTDGSLYVVDGGNWYQLSTAQFNNLGGPGSPMTILPTADAPNSITAWTSVIVKGSNGTYYVIDGGSKRTFNNPVILNWWTNNQTLSVPTVTNGFLNLLPTVGYIERAIKGSSPAVYSAQGGVKSHVLYSSTFNEYYAPYMLVSDALINAMPTGADISN